MIHSIARTNRAPVPSVSMADFAEIDHKLGKVAGADQVRSTETRLEASKSAAKAALAQLTNVRALFQDRTMARLTILLWLTFIW